ncbi:B12-binding domain-containing radical SAM protein [Candidatus Woesearchaeota archaeon]|nr:B12-binding domain-containing radical SAM protein [Candidatus Woesearchaeota archaeon]
MSDVVLVYPIPTNEQTETMGPPLSILYLGSFLEDKGFIVDYYDERISPVGVLKDYLREKPLLIAVSSMTGYQLLGARRSLQLAKEIAPETKTILGGVHASLVAEQCLKESYVDFVCIGEGELTLLELTKMLKEGKHVMHSISGLGWKDQNNRVFINKKRDFMDLDQSVAPITKKSAPLYEHYPWKKVQISRGCPHRCVFCYNTYFNERRYRIKSIDKIEEELKVLKDFFPSMKQVTLLSDNIGRNKTRVKAISELMKSYNFKWHTGIRSEYIDQEMIDILESSCDSLFLGVESASPRIIKFINKDNTSEDALNAAKIISKSSIKPYYSFMTGFPDETKEEILASMDLADKIQKIDPKSIITPFFIFTAFPGTELYKFALTYEGYTSPNSFDEWSSFSLNQVSMPWMDKKTSNLALNLYYISMLLYLEEKDYSRTKFEKAFFNFLKSRARQKWQNRDFNFDIERELFTKYNEDVKVKQLSKKL